MGNRLLQLRILGCLMGEILKWKIIHNMKEEVNLYRRYFIQALKYGMKEKAWELFTADDAKTILATYVPQRSVEDRVVWAMSTEGIYDVKTGYFYWQNQFMRNSVCIVSGGWKKLWRLNIPHKIKIFLWRVCKNNLEVRNCLRNKGIPTLVPVTRD